jgi:hypothetical protein
VILVHLAQKKSGVVVGRVFAVLRAFLRGVSEKAARKTWFFVVSLW